MKSQRGSFVTGTILIYASQGCVCFSLEPTSECVWLWTPVNQHWVLPSWKHFFDLQFLILPLSTLSRNLPPAEATDFCFFKWVLLNHLTLHSSAIMLMVFCLWWLAISFNFKGWEAISQIVSSPSIQYYTVLTVVWIRMAPFGSYVWIFHL